MGTTIRGKYRVDAFIATGAMASVYAATHRNGARVALKIIHPQLIRDTALAERFKREGYFANSIEHPGVARAIDDDVTEDGAPFLVMELLEGETLETRRRRRGGRVPLAELLMIADGLLDVLSAAHAREIIHRDLKPDNVFITESEEVKVLDFGVARFDDRKTSSDMTGTGMVVGTPAYMPPEQALGKRAEVDAQSDIWAVGATLFVCLAGVGVHEGGDAKSRLIATARNRARPLASVAPEVPRGVASVVDRALAYEKEERWPSADTMREALRWARRGLRDDDPSLRRASSAPPPGIAQRLNDDRTMPGHPMVRQLDSTEMTVRTPQGPRSLDATAIDTDAYRPQRSLEVKDRFEVTTEPLYPVLRVPAPDVPLGRPRPTSSVPVPNVPNVPANANHTPPLGSGMAVMPRVSSRPPPPLPRRSTPPPPPPAVITQSGFPPPLPARASAPVPGPVAPVAGPVAGPLPAPIPPPRPPVPAMASPNASLHGSIHPSRPSYPSHSGHPAPISEQPASAAPGPLLSSLVDSREAKQRARRVVPAVVGALLLVGTVVVIRARAADDAEPGAPSHAATAMDSATPTASIAPSAAPVVATAATETAPPVTSLAASALPEAKATAREAKRPAPPAPPPRAAVPVRPATTDEPLPTFTATPAPPPAEAPTEAMPKPIEPPAAKDPPPEGPKASAPPAATTEDP
ncbi:Serine/threonine protein kinase PknB [Labilithrix luteola]|uniref:Serine/threonine protein kinase PknB n=1 Tax=Labilithrix luteola TaxID=1391654 RepID=A0A0K1Q7Z9_9BACT|nr:serine/threonine-protein kinase [Labilithrix luteola]AKV01941.1 Serine/threonine protein kinase PknB [Labilithrix luteola]